MDARKNCPAIAVCDDDDHDRKAVVDAISEYLDKNDRLAVIDQFASGEEFLASDTDRYSIAVLDIYTPGINGMETAERLFAGNTRTKIIFCSSSAEFGVRSYDVNAAGYLIKPLAKEKLFAILDNFFRVFTSLMTITVKVGRIEETVYLNDIIYFESDRHNCIVHTKKGDIVTRATFDKLREQLPRGEFVQPIRYALVSLRAVTSAGTAELKLEDGSIIPISKDQREAVKKAYVDYRWKKMYEKL